MTIDISWSTGLVMLIIGGARSGKSRFALDICSQSRNCRNRIFMATARCQDIEMEDRILRHQKERGREWTTVEEPLSVAEKIREIDRPDTIILVDCLTLWLSNLFMEYGENQDMIEKEITGLEKELAHVNGNVVLVTNEVGSGIVPQNSLARRYRDISGFANQRIAAVSNKVVQVVAGLPILLKDE